jgi:hypothetical protein
MKDDTDRRDNEPGDEQDLAEVIRLQAEALARISGRMAGRRAERHAGETGGGAGGVKPPPRASIGQLVRTGAPAGGSGLPVLADDAALSLESMPVLNAFRQFLDAERRRARRRQMALAGVFIALLAAVMAVGVIVGRRHLARMQAEVDAAREESVRDRAESEEHMRRMALTAADMSDAREQVQQDLRGVAEGTAALRQELTNQLRAARQELVRQVAFQTNEILRLQDVIASLQIENAQLGNRLATMAAAPRTENVLPETPPGQDDGLTPIPEPLPAAGDERMDAPAAPPVEAGAVPLTLRPQNLPRPVQIRLPVAP